MALGVGFLLVSLGWSGAHDAASGAPAYPGRIGNARRPTGSHFAGEAGNGRLLAGLKSAIGAPLRTIGYGRMQPQAVMAKLAEIQLGIAGQHRQQAEAFGDATRDLVRSGNEAILIIAAVAGPAAAADAIIKQALADPFQPADRFRQAARYYAPFAPAKARTAYAEAIACNPRDPSSLIEIGRLHKETGNLADAGRYLERAWSLAPRTRDKGRLWVECGDLFVADDNLAEARRCYVRALVIAENLTGDDADDLGRRVDLSVCHNRLGDCERLAGNPTRGRVHFEVDLAIAQLLATHDPHSAEWQRDLSVCHARLADLETECGNPDAARGHLEQALAIRMRLATDAPRNLVWQRELLKTHAALGRLEHGVGNLVQARFHCEWHLAIARSLSQSEPGNDEWRGHQTASLEQMAVLRQASAPHPMAR
jgi:tetratricopeptide (TPR) repeat protein